MKGESTERKEFASGQWKGEIQQISENKNSKYKYLDIVLTMEGVPFTIKSSIPANFSEGSKLYTLFQRAGMKTTIGTTLDTDDLVGKKVKFTVEEQKDKTGKYVMNPKNNKPYMTVNPDSITFL